MSPPKNLTRVILAASAGNALEFYDFTVFGYFAIQIAAAFFPSHSQYASLMATWATYGTAFLARPVGALVLGSYADRVGRRAAMTAAILLMTAGTFLMTAMPPASAIGPLAPAGILIARLMQGFSAGGEFGGATAFMMEHAPGRRGFFASFQFISQAVSTLAGACIALLVNELLSPADMANWGFRVPFAIGLLIGPVGLYLRRHVDETPVFLSAQLVVTPARQVPFRHPAHLAVAAIAFVGFALASLLTWFLARELFQEWEPRLPWIAGILIIAATFYVYRTDKAWVVRTIDLANAPALNVLLYHPGRVLLGAGLIAGGTAATYIGIYLPTYAQHELHMRVGDSFAAPILGAIVSMVVTPVIAASSDRFGRAGPMILFCVLLAATSIPAFRVVSASPTLGTLIAMTLLIGVLRAGYSAPMPALLAELFPPAMRAVGMSVAYSGGVVIFGSLAPLISTWLIDVTGDRTAPGWYVCACACISLAAVLAIAARVPLHSDR
jgi:MFS transporter, MHS family, proline/betaine transporter